MWKIILVIFLFIVLGSVFAYKYFGTNSEDTSQVLQTGENIIYVSEQRPASSVLVDWVSMVKGGYVVIYDDNNGKPGEIIGNSKILPEGESRNVPISLVRPTINGEFLFAMLHEDNGDGFFNPSIDILLRDQDGNIMYMIFGIDQNAPTP